ncbi:MAG: alpha/beta fold hydrolase [Pseudomonadota bacterium]
MNKSANRYMQLSDGRRLSYSDTGSGRNGTWIHCHGIPGSRHELAHLHSAVHAADLRLIVPDRPGYGSATPLPHYGFSQHSDDLAQLADHLGLERFSVSGFSGGGVFAMATVLDLGERVSQLTIIATPAVPLMRNPFDHASNLTADAWRSAIRNPEALALELQPLTASAEELCQAFLAAAGPDEARYLSSQPRKESFTGNFHTALNQGPVAAASAIARDSGLIANRWPFSPERLTVPVRVVHGQEDQLVHPAHQRALITCLHDAESCVVDDAGHYSALSAMWET